MNRYNPNIHHRRSIRLKGYDYSQTGLYFITICIQDKRCLFGEIINNDMALNEFGIIAYQQWEKLSERYSNFILDVFQIMPNHIHGIISLTNPVGATLAVAPDNSVAPDDSVAPDNSVAPDDSVDKIGAQVNRAPTAGVGDMVGVYKSLVANECLKIFKQNNPGKIMGKLWQRNYHDHIIRNEQSYNHISEYIVNNPKNWKADKFNK